MPALPWHKGRHGDQVGVVTLNWYLGASTGIALASERIAGKPAWAAPLPGWHRLAPGTKLAAMLDIGMTTGE